MTGRFESILETVWQTPVVPSGKREAFNPLGVIKAVLAVPVE